LDWHTIDGGGGTWCTGDNLELSGTIGQPDASQVIMSGGNLELAGGFWAGVPTGVQLPGNCDGDGDVDLDDFAIIAPCMTGPGISVEAGCECADLDGDLDSDLSDFAEFQLTRCPS